MREGQLLHGDGHLQAFTAEQLVWGAREQFTMPSTALTPSDMRSLGPVRLLLEAFSHWSYEDSGGTSFISGFQGVGTIITEAAIHDTE